MNRLPAIVVMLVLFAGTVLAQDLANISLDAVNGTTPRIEIDYNIKTEGRASTKITTGWPTTVCLGEVADLDVENARLIYTAKAKSDLDGNAFLEMWIHMGDRRYFSKGIQDSIKGKSDWRTIRTPFVFQAGQRPDKVTLNLIIEGQGTVWIDDIVLSTEPLD